MTTDETTETSSQWIDGGDPAVGYYSKSEDEWIEHGQNDPRPAVEFVADQLANTQPVEPVVQARQPLTHSQAVKACGISARTLTRRLQAGAIEGATKGATGEWLIPIEGLIAAGYPPNVSRPEKQPVVPVQDRGEIERLRSQLAAAEARAEAAAIRNRDLERALDNAEATARVAEKALLMLEAGSQAAKVEPVIVEPVNVPPVVEEPKRKRWGRR